MTLEIFEVLSGVQAKSSDYKYDGRLSAGEHVFVFLEIKCEVFAKRKTAPSGWHLKRGGYYYEFCRSIANDWRTLYRESK